MPHRSDIPFFQISNLSAFDKGMNIIVGIEGEFNLDVGDTVDYEAGSNLSGEATIIKSSEPRNGKTVFVIKKVS